MVCQYIDTGWQRKEFEDEYQIEELYDCEEFIGRIKERKVLIEQVSQAQKLQTEAEKEAGAAMTQLEEFKNEQEKLEDEEETKRQEVLKVRSRPGTVARISTTVVDPKDKEQVQADGEKGDAEGENLPADQELKKLMQQTDDAKGPLMSQTGPCLADFDDTYLDTVDVTQLLEIYDVFLEMREGTLSFRTFTAILTEVTNFQETYSLFTQPTAFELFFPGCGDLYMALIDLYKILGRKRFTDICKETLMKPEWLQYAKMRDQIWELVKEAMQRVVEKMLEGHTDCEHLTAEFFKYLEKQYGQNHNMGDAVKDSKLLVKTLSYLYENKDTYGQCFEMICEQILKEPDWLRLSEMRGPIRDCLRVALLRVVEKMRGGQTHRVNFIKGFSECVKRLYEQHEHKLFNMGETVEESKLLDKSSVELHVNMGLKIHEKVQQFNFTNSLLFDIDRLSGLLKLMSLEELVIALKAMMEDMINSLGHAVVCFLSNALLLLICSMLLCQGTLFNCKKKARLKYQYEKATLLILWRCGDVERNPGPASSDKTRAFCKKMISMLVDWYWKMKPEQKPKKANKYDTKPDGWPAGSWYGDPSKGTNEERNDMLKTLRKTCIDNGVEVPSKWLNVIEKYLSKEANAKHLHSWLCRQQSIETIDQMFDRLPEIDEEERYEILEHMFKKMKSYLPDTSSQYLQSRKLGPKSRKMEFETLSTLSPDRENNRSTKEVAFDLLAVDGILDPNGTSVVQVTPEIDSEKTSNEGFVAGNNELSTVQLDNLSSTSFLGLLSDNTTRFAASNTTVTPSYACDKNVGDTANSNDGNYRKRKLETREDGNETEIATKCYKTSDNCDCETAVPFPNGDDVNPVGEELPKPKDGGISGFTAIAPIRDNMPTVRVSDFHERDTISADQPDDLVPCPYCGGSGKVSYSLMNEPEKHLADDFISENFNLPT